MLSHAHGEGGGGDGGGGGGDAVVQLCWSQHSSRSPRNPFLSFL